MIKSTLFFTLCLLISRAALTADPTSFSIATWNLEWYFDEYLGDNYSELAKQQTAPSRSDWDWKRDAVADAIAKLNVDVIGLQEVESSRVLWYTTRALDRNHKLDFQVAFSEGSDVFTEQDVGFLYRNVDAVRLTRHLRPRKPQSDVAYFDVAKHLQFEFIVDPAGAKERIVVLNLHLRSRPEGEELRVRQARLVRHWIDAQLKSGGEFIILGDTNSEHAADAIPASSELAILMGHETHDTGDDLVDLHTKIPVTERQTHLVPGKQFDRILVTPGLLQDDPSRKDLVLTDVRVRPDVCIRGKGPDEINEHFEKYWSLPAEERDVSDHYPVVAIFELR